MALQCAIVRIRVSKYVGGRWSGDPGGVVVCSSMTLPGWLGVKYDYPPSGGAKVWQNEDGSTLLYANFDGGEVRV